jgi:bleomycin hydrolase
MSAVSNTATTIEFNSSFTSEEEEASPAIPREITKEFLDRSNKAIRSDPIHRVISAAIASKGALAIVCDPHRLSKITHAFEHRVKPMCTPPNQGSSGRCWLFAGLNVLRMAMMKEYDLPEDFELSQTYPFFWDKLEKANYFLNNFIDEVCQERDEPFENTRLFSWMLHSPLEDGGQWDMFVNLVKKYGVVPKSEMDENFNTKSSRSMGTHLTNILRGMASRISTAQKEGASKSDLLLMKGEMMTTFHKVLTTYLTEPPEKFDWSYGGKKGKKHKEKGLTPLSFAEKFVPIDLCEYVCLINDPRESSSYNQLYTVKYLGNVSGGKPVRYINLPVEEMKEYTLKSLRDRGEAVWMGCDVGKNFHRSSGVIDPSIFQKGPILGVSSTMSKAEKLVFGASMMTHAMVFVGVDTEMVDGAEKTRKWDILNSWGDESGHKGHITITDPRKEGVADGWEAVYEVAVPMDMLKPEHLAILEQEPAVLPPWDPMGALA